MSLSDRVRTAVDETLQRLALDGAFGANGKAALTAANWGVERPKNAEHGDFSTNVAMVLTKKVGMAPRAIAEKLVAALASNAIIRSAEIAGPGFVNLRLHSTAIVDELREIRRIGPAYGRAPSASKERVNIEFVSANPTGPITVGSARGAIYGDTVARLLEATGNRVVREYYINDFGNQVRLFADSVAASAKGAPPPENGYRGEYVAELAAWIQSYDKSLFDGDRSELSRACIGWMLEGIPGSRTLIGVKKTLATLGVNFDVWFSEESLHRWGHVAMSLRQLESSGALVEKDGAVFFKANDESTDDKDRVVKKSDGAYTYFASDIAYHADKVRRGYDRLIDVLGADHHGYVARVRNAIEALGMASDRFEALLYQLVYIYRDGELSKSSKRAGNIVTADELMEEIDAAAGRAGAGRDALRFFFLSRSANSNVDFDVDLAKKKSLDNPVFYVQYGYARLCSILKKADELGIAHGTDPSPTEWVELKHPDELALASRLADFPVIVEAAAASREPHRIVFYVQELARDFQSYFTRLKSENDPILPFASVRAEAGWENSWNHAQTRARLAWIEAIQVVYGAALALIGVGAPERMDRAVAAEDDKEELA